VNVALLIAPVEVRIKKTPADRFPFEGGGVDEVYAIAYIFPEEVGLDTKNTFLGDGGLTVYASPDFAIVGLQADAEIPFSGGRALVTTAGTFGIYFFTIARPWPASRPRPGSIDLTNSVERWTASHQTTRSLRLAPDAVRIGALTYFEVQ
jgi:hypothetical protein